MKNSPPSFCLGAYSTDTRRLRRGTSGDASGCIGFCKDMSVTWNELVKYKTFHLFVIHSYYFPSQHEQTYELSTILFLSLDQQKCTKATIQLTPRSIPDFRSEVSFPTSTPRSIPLQSENQLRKQKRKSFI